MRTNSKLARSMHFYNQMSSLGFTMDETETLRRAQLNLRTWGERECNGQIQRDESTGKPYWYNTNTGHRLSIARDTEHGALQRISAVMANHPALTYYHQTDPRGCALYILKRSQIEGHDIDSIYNRGFGVCI